MYKNNSKKEYSLLKQFLMWFNPICRDCGSKDNTIVCYAGNPYAKYANWKAGRQCSNCINFWYDK